MKGYINYYDNNYSNFIDTVFSKKEDAQEAFISRYLYANGIDYNAEERSIPGELKSNFLIMEVYGDSDNLYLYTAHSNKLSCISKTDIDKLKEWKLARKNHMISYISRVTDASKSELSFYEIDLIYERIYEYLDEADASIEGFGYTRSTVIV